MFTRCCMFFLLVGYVCLSAAEDHSGIRQPTITPQNSGTRQGLIAVSPVSTRVVWVGGRGGTFLLTTNGGKTWKSGVVSGAEALQFRDVQGVSEKVAYLLSIGSNTTDFRIYKTEDAGETWSLQFENDNPNAFFDCFAFWNPRRGIAHSDSVNGKFPDLRTTDGRTWQDISNNLPAALPGEASFASSGTCITTLGERNAWIATGGSTTARVLATRDGGDSWNAFDTPLVSSPTAGAFTLAFRDGRHGIVGGGDLDPNNPQQANTAVSEDGGRSWRLTNKPPVTGA
ncbi:MAG: oxidoreductase, partial [Acidobacteria bacterium]|nr:oxidoreductase [Acidobacteriota bacterium]